jgi:glycolate oxidase iron-sulfur subunit
MDGASLCCGAGGSYAITQRDFSLRLLDSKMSAVEGTEADTVATANPGCLIQLQLGVRRSGRDMRVRYITDLLDESYRGAL